jgi:hypothetical protein
MVVGAKVTRHGTRVTDANTLTRGADVAGSWRLIFGAKTWHHFNWRQASCHRSRRQDHVLSTQIYREMDICKLAKSEILP